MARKKNTRVPPYYCASIDSFTNQFGDQRARCDIYKLVRGEDGRPMWVRWWSSGNFYGTSPSRTAAWYARQQARRDGHQIIQSARHRGKLTRGQAASLMNTRLAPGVVKMPSYVAYDYVCEQEHPEEELSAAERKMKEREERAAASTD